MYGLNITVKGNVQGVGYRYFCKMMADRLKVFGTVKNNPDGSVEIMAGGDEYSVKAFLEYCKQGPSLARIKHVDTKEIDFNKKYVSFEIL